MQRWIRKQVGLLCFQNLGNVHEIICYPNSAIFYTNFPDIYNLTYYDKSFRNSISQQYENSLGPEATEDEEEAKYLAKRKMLGNIKFIGELGKLQIVHDSILHR